MLGYFAPLLPGELFHGAIARTARLNGLKSHFEIGLGILGKNTRPTYGVRFPKYGNVFASCVPKGLGLDCDTILSHSLYPAYAPFLEEPERSKLRSSILSGVNRGKTCREPLDPLRYCPKCAAIDLERHRTVYWHVEPQHPGVTACSECGSQLVDSKAELSITRCLLHAPEWIDQSQAACPATEHEAALARDLRWLLTQNRDYPGGGRLARALKGILGSCANYGRGPKTVRFPRIIADVRQLYSEALLVRIGLHREWSLRHAISPNTPSINFQAYSVIARVAGASLQELFSLAMHAEQPICLATTHLTVDAAHLSRAKAKILKFLGEHPSAGLKELHSLRPRALKFLLKHDPDWCASNLPARRTMITGRCPIAVDWKRRDAELAADLTEAKARLLAREETGEPVRINQQILLNEIARPRRLTNRELSLLPLTKKVLQEALDTSATYVERRAPWMAEQCMKTARCLGLSRFIELGNMRNDCDLCPDARAIAMVVWERYRQGLIPNRNIPKRLPTSAA